MPELAQYGILGIIVIALAGYIIKIEARHKAERDEWRKFQERQTEESNKNIRDNTSVLSGLKTLLENRR